MFLAFFGTLLASLSAKEVCDAVGSCREEESLLQTIAKGEFKTEVPSTDSVAATFCPEFFQAKDAHYVSMGVQQAEEIVLKYCLEIGIAREHCEEEVETVFRTEGGVGQDLTAGMCTDLLALSTFATEMVSESPAALLARQSGSGRDDDTTMDAAFMSKSPPPPPPPPLPPHQASRRRMTECRGGFNHGLPDRVEECRRRGLCENFWTYKSYYPDLSSCV